MERNIFRRDYFILTVYDNIVSHKHNRCTNISLNTEVDKSGDGIIFKDTVKALEKTKYSEKFT